MAEHPPATVNIRIATERLGVSKRTVYNMLKDGRLFGMKKTALGTRITVDSIEQVKAAQTPRVTLESLTKEVAEARR